MYDYLLDESNERAFLRSKSTKDWVESASFSFNSIWRWEDHHDSISQYCFLRPYPALRSLKIIAYGTIDWSRHCGIWALSTSGRLAVDDKCFCFHLIDRTPNNLAIYPSLSTYVSVTGDWLKSINISLQVCCVL